jgi:hypothetical protein
VLRRFMILGLLRFDWLGLDWIGWTCVVWLIVVLDRWIDGLIALFVCLLLLIWWGSDEYVDGLFKTMYLVCYSCGVRDG